MNLKRLKLLLYDFREGREHEFWNSIDDRVMGGKSQSRLASREDFAEFTGEVSTDNYGGFCSVHGPPLRRDLSAFAGFKVTAKGDGKGYRLLAYTTGRTASYRNVLPVSHGWSTVKIPFDNLKPYKWGWYNPFASGFNPAEFEKVGFQVGYKQEGKFSLKVKKVEVY